MTLARIKNYLFALCLASLLLLPVGMTTSAFAQEAHAVSGAKSTPESQSPEKNRQEEDESAAYKHSPMVQKMGSMLGMTTNQAATAFEVTNFVILAVLVGWFLLKTLPKTFKDRNTAIQKHLVDARTATEEASARLNSVEDRLAKLDDQIAAMTAQAEQDSVKDEQRIKAAVEDEKKKILAAADQEIAAATMHAQKQLKQYAAELAIEQAARKLVVTAETDRLLVQRFAQRLAGDDAKKGQN